MASPRSTTPTQWVPPGLILIVFFIMAFNIAQPTMAQWYCNGRAAVTMPTAGCGGVSVCSPLMAAVSQTRNWWNGTNNTVGNSLGVAATNFFTTFVYTPLLTITNTNGTNGIYSTACKKIAAVVNQVLLWANKTQANWTMANATYGATAKQELYGTVIPGWGYTIGQYIACGTSCINYTSTTSTTSTTTTRTSTTSTTTTRTSTTTKTLNVCEAPVNTSGVIYLKATSDEFYPQELPSGSCACSSPFGTQLYMPGLNTPQSTQDSTDYYSVRVDCWPADPPDYDFAGAMCLCSPNGSCYSRVGESGDNFYNRITSWCGADGSCHSYLTRCTSNGNNLELILDAVTGQPAYNCTFINELNTTAVLAASCPGPSCPFPMVDYVLCDNCSAGGLKPEISCGPSFSAYCEGAPSIIDACYFVVGQPTSGSGENFPTFTRNANGSCGGCVSPNETQYYFDTRGPYYNFTCWNGANPSQPDWTGMCFCTLDGNCFHFELLAGSNGTINDAVSYLELEPLADDGSCINQLYIYCAEVNEGVQLVDVYGNVAGTCDRDDSYSFEVYAAISFRCNGGCPTDEPLDEFCQGPYVPAQ